MKDLPFSHSLRKQLVRLREFVAKAAADEEHRMAVVLFDEFTFNIQAEMETHLFLCVPADRRPYFERAAEVFGPTILDVFPESRDDIIAACRCFSLDQSTACVFHLMRALESPLAALSGELGITKHSPTWNAYLAAMHDAIGAKYPDKTKEHADKKEYLSGLEGQLRAIKDAWRNPTMHEIAKVYTDPMADELIVLVRGFMREAARGLHG